MNRKIITSSQRKRLATIEVFLRSENISLSSLDQIKGDASFRTYYRIKDRNLLLMDANPKTNEKISSFIKIQKKLSLIGVRTPKIFKKSVSLGLMIIEDFGSLSFIECIEGSETHPNLYYDAIEVLIEIHEKSMLWPEVTKNIKKYTFNEQIKETELYFEWYLSKHLKKRVLHNEKVKFYKILKKIYKELDIKNYSLVLRDFHIDNIIPFHDDEPPLTTKNIIDKFALTSGARYTLGIIDFQDALIGSPAYDFCSLIEDVRAPMDQLQKESLISKYIFYTKNYLYEKKNGEKEDCEKKLISAEKIKIAESTLMNFKAQISYFSIQRNLKILGIFSRLKYRDKKTKYKKYLPTAKKFVREHIKKPQFKELKDWFAENKISV